MCSCWVLGEGFVVRRNPPVFADPDTGLDSLQGESREGNAVSGAWCAEVSVVLFSLSSLSH